MLCHEEGALSAHTYIFVTVVYIPWDEASFPSLKNVTYNFIGLYLVICTDENRNPAAFLVFRP